MLFYKMSMAVILNLCSNVTSEQENSIVNEKYFQDDSGGHLGLMYKQVFKLKVRDDFRMQNSLRAYFLPISQKLRPYWFLN